MRKSNNLSPDFHCFMDFQADCGIPQANVSNAALIWTGRRIGDIATMTCEENYVIPPPGGTPPLWLCDVSGEWVLQTSGSGFSCQEVSDLDIIIISCLSVSLFHHVLTYSTHKTQRKQNNNNNNNQKTLLQ